MKLRNVILAVVLAIVLVPLIYHLWVTLEGYQIMDHQSQATSNLRWIYRLETEYFKRYGRFGNFDEIKFMPPGENGWYTYRIGPPGDATSIRVGKHLTRENTVVASGISAPPAPGFTATATSNLDSDSVIDEWHINDQGIKEGLQLRPTHDVDDHNMN